MRRTSLFLVLATTALLGCVGEIGDGPTSSSEVTGGGPTDPQAFACEVGDPSATVLPRLSHDRYLSALRALTEATLGAAEIEPVMTALSATLTLVPADSDPDHARLDQNMSQAHVDGHWYAAVAFAEQLTSTNERTAAVVGSCATDADAANDDACLDDFIRGFGKRAHRRPLTDEQVAFYRDEVFEPADGMDVLAIRDVLVVMVLSPWFLYQVEDEGAPVHDRADLFELSPHELASRLAFHFWNAPPDDALTAAAESGALSTEEGYAAEVDRLLADPRARATIDRFFSEWLLLDDLAPLHQSVGTPVYDAFVGAEVPTAELRGRVLEDLLDLVRWHTWETGGSLDDLFLSNLSFARTDDVAALYGGVPLWDSSSQPQPLPESERAGLLTRPAMLATGSNLTHPVLRGREIRKRVLCDVLDPPPPNAMMNLPELPPLTSERERMEAFTEQSGSSCFGCHVQMNGLGFTLGAFDGLGRTRALETIFADDGAVLGELPIDTAAPPHVVSPGDETLAADAVEMSEQVVESGKPHACFARHYFRFTFGRAEDDEVDGCTLEGMRKDLREGASVADILRRIALDPTFRRRKLAE